MLFSNLADCGFPFFFICQYEKHQIFVPNMRDRKELDKVFKNSR